MKFKVGDKVRRKRNFGYHFDQGPGYEGTITAEPNRLGYMAVDGKTGASADYYELVTEDKNSEAYLQSLVNKANEGLKAAYELRKLERLEYRDGNDCDWIKLTYDLPNEEYRLTPPKPSERKFRLQDWDCVITADTVKVGCQEFNRSLMYSAFKAILQKGHRAQGDFAATRKGIEAILRFQSYVLTWENADKLLAELEAFERGEV